MPGSTITAKAADHHHTGQIAQAAADWRTQAACRGRGRLMDPPPAARTIQLQWEAQDLCMGCPVLKTCLHWVLALPEDLDPGGVCGALTEKERTAVRAADRSRFKYCPRCEAHKLRSEFYTYAEGRTSGYCKPCKSSVNLAAYHSKKGTTE